MKFSTLNICGAVMVAAISLAGWTQSIYSSDKTGITIIITVLFLFGLFQAYRFRWSSVRWIADRLVFLGLIGTVVGFIMALASIDPKSASDAAQIGPMVRGLLEGMATALYTTLLGSVGYLWLSINAKLLADEEV